MYLRYCVIRYTTWYVTYGPFLALYFCVMLTTYNKKIHNRQSLLISLTLHIISYILVYNKEQYLSREQRLRGKVLTSKTRKKMGLTNNNEPTTRLY